MAHSPHRRHKGCQLCKYHKFADHGWAVRDPWRYVKWTGKRRRVRRGEVPVERLEG